MVAKRKRITGAGPAKRPPKRRGLFPGEYERTSTVVHSEDVMEFGRLSEMNAEQREAYLRSETDGYGRSKRFFIVHTRRMDSRWTFTIESGGERWVLPLKVVEQMARTRDSIHKELRQEKALEMQATRARRKDAEDRQLREASVAWAQEASNGIGRLPVAHFDSISEWTALEGE